METNRTRNENKNKNKNKKRNIRNKFSTSIERYKKTK